VAARGLAHGKFSVDPICSSCCVGSTARAVDEGLVAGSFECFAFTRHEVAAVRRRRVLADTRPPPGPPPRGLNLGARPSPTTMMGAEGAPRRILWDARDAGRGRVPTPVTPAFGQSPRSSLMARQQGPEQYLRFPVPAPQRHLLQFAPPGADQFGSPAAATGGGSLAARGRGRQPLHDFSPAGLPAPPTFAFGPAGGGQENRYQRRFDLFGVPPKSAPVFMNEMKERYALLAAAEATGRGESSSLNDWRAHAHVMNSPRDLYHMQEKVRRADAARNKDGKGKAAASAAPGLVLCGDHAHLQPHIPKWRWDKRCPTATPHRQRCRRSGRSRLRRRPRRARCTPTTSSVSRRLR